MCRGVLKSIFAIGLMAILWAPQVRADGIDFFDYTENTVAGPLNLEWQLPESPSLDASSFTGSSFTVAMDTGLYSFDGITAPFADTFTFLSADSGGGLNDLFGDSGLVLVTALGDQMYTGDTSSPTFASGSYDIVDLATGSSGTLVISTPEPSALLLLCVGLCGVVTVSLRRRLFA